jgi:hypothetical protein
MDPFFYSIAFKASYLLAIIPTLLVITSAVMSIKHMGGTLGQGLKKIATGSVIHTIIIATYLLLEQGNRGILDEQMIWIFFLTSAVFGSTLLISGYIQIYKIARKLKLFTP